MEREASAERQRACATVYGLRVRCGFQMLPQQIASEISLEVAPHRVDVVRVVLRVVVLDEEGRPLHAVVVFLAALGVAGPREADLLDAGLPEARGAIRGDVGR